MNWHSKEIKEVLKYFDSDEGYGLTNNQAEVKAAQWGPNEIASAKKTGVITKFFMQFNDFMVFILLLAAGISMGISMIRADNDYLDPIIILAIVILNAVMGLVQELKAEKALEALKELSAPSARVIRSGKAIKVEAKNLVPGDIILIQAGDKAPADARLIESSNLKADESALTGESAPVEKSAAARVKESALTGDRKNMVFSSTIIKYGRGKAVVTATGAETEVGKIAGLIGQEQEPLTPLQLKLAATGKLLGVGALGICALIFIIGILRSFPPFFMFMTSVSLAVAAIPEGLPAIVTIMLAIGVQRMAVRNAVIRRLPAVETLGSANVICSDKTGTLTQNKMTVTEIAGINGILSDKSEDRKLILQYGALCNDSIMEVSGHESNLQGDPTETALIFKAYEALLLKSDLEEVYPRVSEIPFDSARKLMTTVHKAEGGYLVITKGAPDILLDKCQKYNHEGRSYDMDKTARKKAESLNGEMASRALRVIGIGAKFMEEISSKAGEFETDLVFLGLFGLIDPPRPEASMAVRQCRQAGIKPVMITGDHVLTAKAIARKIGIMETGGKALTGEELNKLTQEELNQCIGQYSVFARVTPEHKVRIVKAFQNDGNVVAMTGDGVNDAPALKAADIGCAMGIMGTDVAKGAADMVLMDDNFATIVAAVREGRGIYSNIRKAIHFLLSSNIGEILTIFISILLGWDMPLLAIHLLWVNLITDSLPAIALGLDLPEDDIMEKKPFTNRSSFFAGGLWRTIAVEGAMIGLLAIIAFGTGKLYFDAPGICDIARTMCFATLSISQLVHAFNMRSDKSIFSLHIRDNMYLVYAFLVGTALEAAVIMIPAAAAVFKVVALDMRQWAIVAILSFMPLIIVELEKFLSREKKGEQEKETISKKFLPLRP